MADLKSIIQNGYKKTNKQDKNLGAYVRDDNLSGNRVQVYHNKENGKTIVNHTGTNSSHDWLTDLRGAFGDLKKTERYKHANKIQKQAVAKYGNENIVTTGHSLGYALAKNAGKNSSHIYGVNGAVLPSDLINKKKQDNITHYKSKGDWVSVLSPFEKNKVINIDNKGSINPLKEHKSDVLDRKEKVVFY